MGRYLHNECVTFIIFAFLDVFHPSEHNEIGQAAQFENFLNRSTTMLANGFKISLNCILKLNEVWPLEGVMYISLWELFSGASRSIIVLSLLCNFLRKLMVSNKKIHMALRTHTTLMNNTHSLEKFLIFTIYQNYTWA